LEVEQWKGGRKVTVVFGGKDILVDTNTVGRYLVGASFKGPQISDKAIRMTREIRTATVSGQVSAEGEEWKTRPWMGSGLEVSGLNSWIMGKFLSLRGPEGLSSKRLGYIRS
jgi:hypothetical protein